MPRPLSSSKVETWMKGRIEGITWIPQYWFDSVFLLSKLLRWVWNGFVFAALSNTSRGGWFQRESPSVQKSWSISWDHPRAGKQRNQVRHRPTKSSTENNTTQKRQKRTAWRNEQKKITLEEELAHKPYVPTCCRGQSQRGGSHLPLSFVSAATAIIFSQVVGLHPCWSNLPLISSFQCSKRLKLGLDRCSCPAEITFSSFHVKVDEGPRAASSANRHRWPMHANVTSEIEMRWTRTSFSHVFFLVFVIKHGTQIEKYAFLCGVISLQVGVGKTFWKIFCSKQTKTHLLTTGSPAVNRCAHPRHRVADGPHYNQ